MAEILETRLDRTRGSHKNINLYQKNLKKLYCLKKMKFFF